MKGMWEIICIIWMLAIPTARPSRESSRLNNKQTVSVGVILPNMESSHWFLKTPLIQAVKQELNELPAMLRKKYHIKHTTVFTTPFELPINILETACDQMVQEKVVAIIYLTPWQSYKQSTAVIQYFMHLNSYTGIPVIAWNVDNPGLLVNRDLNKYRILQMAPTLTHQANAIVQIIKRYEWKNFIVVTTHISGYDRFIETCRKVAGNSSVNMVAYFQLNVKNLTELNEQLKTFNEAESRIFVLFSTHEEAKQIFQAAEKYDLLGAKYMWIATQSITVEPASGAALNLTNFPIGMMAIYYKTDAISIEKSTNVIFKYLPNALKVFKRGLDAYLQVRNYSVDFYSTANCDNDYNFTWAEGEEFYKYLKNVSIEDGENSDEDYPRYPISFDDDGFVKDSYLSIYNLKLERKWEKIGEYRHGKVIIKDITWPGGSMKAPNGIPERYQLKIVTLDEPPFVIVNDIDPHTNKCLDKQGVKCIWGTTSSKNHTEKCCSGFCVDLLDQLSSVMQFNYSLYKVSDGLWGAKTNNQWNGLVAELLYKDADMCVTALKINSEREKDIDFSVPFLETGITIAVAFRDGALSPTAFLEPFEFSTWIFILLVSILAAAIAIFLFEWLSPESFDRKTKPPPGHKFSFFRAYWLVWATLFSASVNTDVPRSHTARFMALVWAAFSLTFLAIYTANLAAFMITRNDLYKLTGINDTRLQFPKSMSPAFRFGTVKDGNTETTLRLNYPKLHNYMLQNNLFKPNVSDGIKAVKNEEYHAFIYDSVVLDYLVGKDDNCKITTVGKWFSMTGYGIGLPKKSKYLKQINKHLLAFQENGYLERYKNFWFTGACSPKSKDKSNPLGVENFVSAFVLLAAGTVICLFLVCIEYLYCNYLRQRMGACNKSGWCGLISLSMGRSLTFKEAVEQVHTDYKKEKSKSIKFTSQREKLLEYQLKSACAEITRLKKEEAYENLIKATPNRTANFGYVYESVSDDAPIKCAEIETVI